MFQGGGKKKYAEDEDFDSESDEGSESEFEDPDEMEVPMGGKSLTASVNKKAAAVEGSDDDIEVIQSVNNGNKFNNMRQGMLLKCYWSRVYIPPFSWGESSQNKTK